MSEIYCDFDDILSSFSNNELSEAEIGILMQRYHLDEKQPHDKEKLIKLFKKRSPVLLATLKQVAAREQRQQFINVEHVAVPSLFVFVVRSVPSCARNDLKTKILNFVDCGEIKRCGYNQVYGCAIFTGYTKQAKIQALYNELKDNCNLKDGDWAVVTDPDKVAQKLNSLKNKSELKIINQSIPKYFWRVFQGYVDVLKIFSEEKDKIDFEKLKRIHDPAVCPEPIDNARVESETVTILSGNNSQRNTMGSYNSGYTTTASQSQGSTFRRTFGSSLLTDGSSIDGDRSAAAAELQQALLVAATQGTPSPAQDLTSPARFAAAPVLSPHESEPPAVRIEVPSSAPVAAAVQIVPQLAPALNPARNLTLPDEVVEQQQARQIDEVNIVPLEVAREQGDVLAAVPEEVVAQAEASPLVVAARTIAALSALAVENHLPFGEEHEDIRALSPSPHDYVNLEELASHNDPDHPKIGTSTRDVISPQQISPVGNISITAESFALSAARVKAGSHSSGGSSDKDKPVSPSLKRDDASISSNLSEKSADQVIA